VKIRSSAKKSGTIQVLNPLAQLRRNNFSARLKFNPIMKTIYFNRKKGLAEVLNELWADIKDRIFGPERKLKPVPLRNRD